MLESKTTCSFIQTFNVYPRNIRNGTPTFVISAHRTYVHYYSINYQQLICLLLYPLVTVITRTILDFSVPAFFFILILLLLFQCGICLLSINSEDHDACSISYSFDTTQHMR